ncbi:hypothetical protein [Longitalea luteola]|uniref:hypothetical protein n=1 Tax=Longitalea luteola TaxID=2812563 RepID=UPI001A973567|nr:hypothetical protein [Longitalea luteola]
MKTNGTHIIMLTVFLQLLFLFFSISVNAQARYRFRNASKISGTDRQVGAQYRFPTVQTGTDALVTITAITGGLILNALDGSSSGFDEAFQPIITLPARSRGYAEFNIQFVTAGTTIPMVQTEVPITPIDIDGIAGDIYEFDEIFLSGSSYVDYNMTGSAIALTFPAANRVVGTNIGGVTYNGVDTIAKDCMFSVVNAGVSSIVVRVGADNKDNSTSDQRLRSIYFKKFTYPNSVLGTRVIPSGRTNNNSNNQPAFKVFPSIFHNTINIHFNAARSGMALLQLADYTGRLVKQQPVYVQEGRNQIAINNWAHISAGQYIAMISQDTVKYMQPILKRS